MSEDDNRPRHPRPARRPRAALCATVMTCAVVLGGERVLADANAIAFAPDYLPDFAGVGVGLAPDYIGSDSFRLGVAPIARISRGERYLDVIANFARANILDHPNWRLGPAATLRLGRDDVDDAVVDRLPDIDPTLELGGFVGYVVQAGEDPRTRLRANVSFTHDVLGESDGFVVAASLKKWVPVGRFGALGLSLATTFASDEHADTYFSVTPAGAAASGLPTYDAGAALRDVRVTAVFVHPVSKSVVLGAGALYGRLLGDAADSPIVSQRGSENQLIFGIGGAVMLW